MMKSKWLSALGKMTYGIYVLTSFKGEEINGMIASWVSQISYEPPLVMAAVHPNRYSHHTIDKSGCFALHILNKDQKDYLSRFKEPDPGAKFSSIQWNRGITGCPILTDCIAYMECKIVSRIQPGNHTLYIGEIVEADIFSDAVAMSTQDYAATYIGNI
jgi:flavin reductase (DIM6/NTAB) family NADH-FMN oxidoreductase RutF